MKAVVPTSAPRRPAAPAENAQSRAPLAAVAACLAEHAPALLAEWRRNFRVSPCPSARALFALEQLLLPDAGGAVARQDRLAYVAARLPRLGLDLDQVRAALSAFRPLAAACLAPRYGRARALALAEALRQRAALAAAEAFVAERGRAVGAFLAVLDAELNATDLSELLQRLLEQAALLFPFRWGEILLLDEGAPADAAHLRHAALWGLEPAMIQDAAGAGPFFQRILRRGTPGFLLDAANDPRVSQPYFRSLEVKSVWAMPLLCRRRAGQSHTPLGVLVLGFDRVYECLPQEMELLRALAERSTLAIERTRMYERLSRQQERVFELSRRLLDAQDEERRRISRDLHDETGQALLALRLYLEMGLRAPTPAAARPWLRRGLALVDSSVAELRRLLAQLSPLVLDELGLEAALRLELRRLRGQQRWRSARFRFRCRGRLDRSLEILVYRIVLEGLRNIARHAQAQNVCLRVEAAGDTLSIRLSDDGVGLQPPARGLPAQSGHFGLSGMRERVRLAGGSMEIQPNPGSGGSPGLLLHICIPFVSPAPRAAAASAS